MTSPASVVHPLDPAGWYSTGDIVSVDAEDFVHIRGRVKRAVQIASVTESMALAERAGLDLQVVRNSRRMLLSDHYQDIAFTPQQLRLKDVRYALELATQLGVGTPFGSQAEAAFRQLFALNLQDANQSAVLEVARLQRPSQ